MPGRSSTASVMESPTGCTKQLMSVAASDVPAAELMRPAGTNSGRASRGPRPRRARGPRACGLHGRRFRCPWRTSRRGPRRRFPAGRGCRGSVRRVAWWSWCPRCVPATRGRGVVRSGSPVRRAVFGAPSAPMCSAPESAAGTQPSHGSGSQDEPASTVDASPDPILARIRSPGPARGGDAHRVAMTYTGPGQGPGYARGRWVASQPPSTVRGRCFASRPPSTVRGRYISSQPPIAVRGRRIPSCRCACPPRAGSGRRVSIIWRMPG